MWKHILDQDVLFEGCLGSAFDSYTARKEGFGHYGNCPTYRLEDETMEHALFWYPKVWLIWRIAGGLPWRTSTGSWPILFLAAIHKSSTDSLAGS